MGVCVWEGGKVENECESGEGQGFEWGTRQNVILAITRGRLHYESDAIYFSKCSGRGVDLIKGGRGCVWRVDREGRKRRRRDRRVQWLRSGCPKPAGARPL